MRCLVFMSVAVTCFLMTEVDAFGLPSWLQLLGSSGSSRSAGSAGSSRSSGSSGSSRSAGSSGSAPVPCSRHSNGCSVPHGLRHLIGEALLRTLTPACNRHDMCYTCGHQYGVSRSLCDRDFLSSMVDACRSSERQTHCTKVARLFYAFVRTLGFVHHVSARLGDRSYCPSVRHCF